jgi:hypothetical protein
MTESTRTEPDQGQGQPSIEPPTSTWAAPGVQGDVVLSKLPEDKRAIAAPPLAGHPPAEGGAASPQGPTQFGHSELAASSDQTTVIPAISADMPLVWPELRGTPLIDSYPLPLTEPTLDAAPPGAWAVPPAQRSRSTQSVTCPQCGTVVQVDAQARSSLDFCPNPACDFPLFWVKSAVIASDEAYADGASHRRLPGTVGRATAAFMPCPHCAEPNPLSGVLCVRCGQDLRPVAPVILPPPPPAPAPVFVAEELDEPINWWLIILVGAAILIFFAVLGFVAIEYIID